MFNERWPQILLHILLRLSLKPGFGGCGHVFSGCDGLGGLDGFGQTFGGSGQIYYMEYHKAPY